MLKAGDIIASAEGRSGITDPEPHLHGALHALVAGLNGDNRLSLAGEAAAHRSIVARSVERLEGVKRVRQHPDIEREGIEAPLFLTGLPRSGFGDLQSLFEGDRRFRLIRAGDRPGRCHALLEQSYGAVSLYALYDAPSHFDYLMRRVDMRATYRVYRRQLQLLQWRAPDARRWALACSDHGIAMDAIVEIFPDARFVMTHRDPVPILAEIAQRTVALRLARYVAPVDAHRVGRQMMDYVRRHIDRMLDFCAGPGGDRVVHVDHHTLAADTPAVLRRLQDALGLGTADDWRAAIGGGWRSARAGDEDGGAPALERFGIEVEEADELFADYRHRFGVTRENHGLASMSA